MRRRCSFKEYGGAHEGHCVLITGGMMSAPEAVVERKDGTLTRIQIQDVQFTDIEPWISAYPSRSIYESSRPEKHKTDEG